MAIERSGVQDYTRYDQDHEYTTVPGVIQTPTASRVPGQRLIRLHGGYGIRTVRWMADRSGKPPIIPSAVDSSDGDVLLGSSVTPSLPRPNDTAGGYDWRVTGVYTFAQALPRVAGTDPLPAGSYPFVIPIQDSIATSMVGSGSLDFVTLGAATITQDGDYVWPFTTLAPAFSSEDLI